MSALVLDFFIVLHKNMPIENACVSALGSCLLFQCLHLLKQPTKTVSPFLKPARITSAFPASIIVNRRTSFFEARGRTYSSTLDGGGYQSSPPVQPDGVTGVSMDALSVEISSGNSEKSARSRKQFALVSTAYGNRVYQPTRAKNNKKTSYKLQKNGLTTEFVKLEMNT